MEIARDQIGSSPLSCFNDINLWQNVQSFIATSLSLLLTFPYSLDTRTGSLWDSTPLSISANMSKSIIVFVANRNQPLKEFSGVIITVEENGNLVILDTHKKVV
jgi:hypothetical protein